MMRRYHRWLSVLFGIFILWIAGTGTIVQFSRMTAPAPERPAASAAASAPAATKAATRDPDRDADAKVDTDADEDGDRTPSAGAGAGAAARPKPDATRQFIHFVTELHSGEEFGVVGQVISLLSGLALVFFAVSGLWMYIELYRGRMVKVRDGKPVRGGRWFWS